MDATPLYSDLVLIGGGHAHVNLLKMYGMEEYKDRLKGIRLTLITRDVSTPYSGMLPGYVSGHYTHEQCHLDLSLLCSHSGFRLIHASATGIEINESGKGGSVTVDDGRPPIRFDALSVDIGSSPQYCSTGSSHITPVKPIDGFAHRWSSLVDRVSSDVSNEIIKVAVVGGGAGGIELTLAINERLKKIVKGEGRVEVTVFNRGGEILQQHNPKVREIFDRILKERNVHVVRNATASTSNSNTKTLHYTHNDTPTSSPFSEIIWCTSASSQPWLRTSAPFETTDDGFILVDDMFQTSIPGIFAAGDCCHNRSGSRPKAGVFAVRAGPILRDNMLNFLMGNKLIEYVLQKEFLGLISTGDKYAVASRGSFALEGAFLWKLKDEIDVKWMKSYKELPEMKVELDFPEIAQSKGAVAMAAFAEAPMRCGGCGAKVGASTLSRVLKAVRERRHLQEQNASPNPNPNSSIPTSLSSMDDCAVCPPPPRDCMTVHTIDFFRSFISDPFIFGRISAVHSLSDCHAMGALPQTALALAVAPYAVTESITEDTLIAMLSGASDALFEEGCALAGGHTCEGAELSLGFAVNGYLPPNFPGFLKAGGQPTNKIVLTKRVGTGALFAAEMRGKVNGIFRTEAINEMCKR
ncbi:hypothetical protein TL16_g08007 [Triparma laevis f. inornata]|uniref:FAD/NAD(P)-binding domain-containing protein n=1 Tax=Triparma laevis f. inornata TaxID=1714386 RepID=A0A9W7EHL9_9STRA|nr:hypothetical protein TL16_g08007 [Triparma laevis f. inornata]